MVTDASSPESTSQGELHDRVRRLEGAVVALGLVLVVVVAWVAVNPPSSHEVLKVERLEIVEPDGQPSFVLANSERPARGTFDGQVLLSDQGSERAMPNFIFFDGHGDEVGGMLFGNREGEDGLVAIRHLSLDGYRQDQTVQLFHRQDTAGAATGLSVTDRPQDRSLRESFTALGLEAPFTRKEAAAAVTAIPDSVRSDSLRTLFGVNRVFLGSSDRQAATLVLKDGDARPRIVLSVAEDGDPQLRLLDEQGKALAELP